jgi:hypothetical protein
MGTWLKLKGRELMTQIIFSYKLISQCKWKEVSSSKLQFILAKNPIWIRIMDVVSTMKKGILDHL